MSVKGGEYITPAMIRDLDGTVEQKRAVMGLFLTLNKPKREMVKVSASACLYEKAD